MRLFKSILQKSSPAAHFICDNRLPSRKMLEKHVKSAVLAKKEIGKYPPSTEVRFPVF
jgi:hypothetical protein